MSSLFTALLTAVVGVLLAGVTVVGVVTASNHSPRPSIDRSQSGIVLYGNR